MTEFFRISAGRALGSLKLRLAIAGVLLIGISVALTVFFVLREVGQRTERALLDAETGHVEKLAGILSSRVVHLQLALRAAAQRLPAGAIDEPQAMVDYLRGEPVLATLFSSVFVVTAGGRMVALADSAGARAQGLSVADRAYFKRTLEEKRPIISDPVMSRVSGDAVITFTLPVTARDGAVAAVLGGAIRLSTGTLLADLTQAGGSDYDPVTTIITDATGRIISHPDKQWLMRDAHTEPRLADAVARWVVQGKQVEPLGSAERLGEHVTAMAGVPDADWMIFRSAPTAVLFGGFEAGRRQALWLGAGVALIGGAIIALATLLMLRPLRQLERRALRLLGDDLAADDGWPHVRGEIGELSRVFRHVIQQRAASQQSNDEMLARMQAVMNHAPVGITFTRNRTFEVVSQHFSRLFGYEGQSLVGESPRLIYASDEVYQALGARVAAAFGAGQPFSEEIEFVRRDGSHFWGHIQGAPVRAGYPAAGTIWTVSDITSARAHRERLSWTATHDPLTDLVNRREFETRLAEQLGERRGREGACALFIDLDHFKAVNDSAGHAAGDAVLKEIAALLAQRVRATDTVARVGGDEFAVLLRSCSSEVATRIAEKMRAAVEGHRIVCNGVALRVGASIGLVQIDETLHDVPAVMAAADAACYAAKRAGRNRVQSHAPALLKLVGRT